MPPSVSTLLRISSELDIIGDVTASVATPSDLLAWPHALPELAICAWRAEDSGNRYVHADRSYSLIKPPRTGRHLIRS